MGDETSQPGRARRARRSARRPAGPPTGIPDAASGHPEQEAEPVAGTAPSPAPGAPAPGRATPAAGSAGVPPAPATQPATPPATQPSGRQRGRGDSAVERGLRSLVTSRPTVLSPTVAMRAREVAVPTPADLAAAEAGLVLVRRNYVPPEPLPAARRAAGTGRASGRSGGKHPGRPGRRRARPGGEDQDGSSGADGSAS